MPGTLYLVATPIGNLGDFSPRAVETLQNADFIAAEDTRVSVKLLNHFDIKKPLVSYHEHNRASAGQAILTRLLGGETCALVTDAGMPAISDPGEALVRLCAENGVPVLAIPGCCAAVYALAADGGRAIVARNCHKSVYHALELTAGALVRVLAVNFLRRGEVHITQRLERTRAALLLRQLRVDSQRLLDLRADAHERVHRGHRLLKDHAELAALNGAQLRAGQAQNIAPVEAHLAGERDLFALDEARERHGGHGLAAAALAHQTHDLAVGHRQVNTPHGVVVGAMEPHPKILDL